MINLIFTIALALYTTTTHADVALDIHISSKHHDKTFFNVQGKKALYNESNLGLGITKDILPGMVLKGGFFNNSYDDTSLYLAIGYHSNHRRLISVGIDMGIVSGYDKAPTQIKTSPIVPMVMPHISVNISRLHIRLGYIPQVSEWITSLTVLSVSIDL